MENTRTALATRPWVGSGTAQLVDALQEYASSPCGLLSDAEISAYRITVGPRMLDELYGGVHRACYWVTSGRQLAWFPDPPPYVQDQDIGSAP